MIDRRGARDEKPSIIESANWGGGEWNLLTYLPPSGETTAIGSCGSDYATAAAKAL